MDCRSCGAETEKFFILGNMPPVNSFLKKDELSAEKKYDLSVCFCPRCYLVQLSTVVPPEDLFRHYLYFSSVSSSFLDYCKTSAYSLAGRFGLTEKSLVLEIASNDGAMLRFFKEQGIGILGVDPAKNIAEEANKKGIRTIPEFFNLKFAEKLSSEGTKADLVFGANVLAHVPEIVDFVKGVKEILSERGSAVFEFPYLMGFFENKFDTIYHEHVFYYSLIALKNLFNRAGLEIYDVELTPVQGGSLRIFAARPGTYSMSENIRELTDKEISFGLDKIETYKKVAEKIDKLKHELIALLEKLQKDGKRVGAYGAAAKGVVLLNYFGIRQYLDFIVDKSPAKQGLYVPGTGMEVFPLDKIYERNPDYLLILCWNIYTEILDMPELKKYKEHGKFIVPIPDIKII